MKICFRLLSICLFALTLFFFTIGTGSLHASMVYAAVTDGSFFGVATFDNDLNLISQIGLSGPITGLAAGEGGNFYTAVGNTLFEFNASGNQLDTISGSVTTTVPALSFAPSVVNPVPEPATMLLLGSGLIGLAGYARKKFFKR